MPRQREPSYRPPSPWALTLMVVLTALVVHELAGNVFVRIGLALPVWMALHAVRAVARGVWFGVRESPLEREMPGPGSLPELIVGPESPEYQRAYADEVRRLREPETGEPLCLVEVEDGPVVYWCTLGRGHAGAHVFEQRVWDNDPVIVSSLEDFERLYGPPPSWGS